MAKVKDSPWFKFKVNNWNTGDIHLLSYHLKGVFTDLCSYYWSKECDVKLAVCEKKFGKSNLCKLLSEEIVKKDGDLLRINFLDEQWGERQKTSGKASEAANSRWGKNDGKNEYEGNATALQTQYEGNAIKKESESKIEKESEKQVHTLASQTDWFFKDLATSSDLEMICINQGISKEVALALIPKFRTNGADPSYSNFQAFTRHFSGWLRKNGKSGNTKEGMVY